MFLLPKKDGLVDPCEAARFMLEGTSGGFQLFCNSIRMQLALQ